jgi:hypothetical protein
VEKKGKIPVVFVFYSQVLNIDFAQFPQAKILYEKKTQEKSKKYPDVVNRSFV